MSNLTRTRKWILVLAITISALIGLLLLLPRLIDLNRYRDDLAGQIEKRLGRRVALGELSWRLIPSPEVRAADVAITEDEQFAAGSFVAARAVRLTVDWGSLLRGRPRLEGIELVEPSVTLIRSAEKRWNWETLSPLQQRGASEPQPPFDLVVEEGRFTIIDRTKTPATETTLSRIDLQLDRFSTEKAFNFIVGMTMPGENGGRIEARGRMGPIVSEGAARTAVKAGLALRQVDLAALESLAGLQLSHAGLLTLDLELDGSLADSLRANGKLKAERLRLVADVEPSSLPLEAEFKLLLNSGADGVIGLRAERADFSIGGTRLSLAGVVERLTDQPRIDLHVAGQGISLASLLESASAFGFGPPPGTRATGEADLSLQVTGEHPAPALTGQAAIRNLRFEGGSLPQPITVSELKFDATPERIAIAPFRSALGSRSTVEVESLAISDYTRHPRLRLTARTVGARLEDLLGMAESFGLRPDLQGTGDANLNATVETALDAFLTELKLNGQGSLSGGTLRTSSLTKPITVRNANLAFTGEAARLSNLDLTLASSQLTGWLEVTGFARPAVTFDLAADRVNIAELQSLVAVPAATKSPRGGSAAPSISADGQLRIGELRLDNLTLTALRSRLSLRNRVLTLDPSTFDLYQGSWRGSVRIDQATPASELALRGSLSGLDLNRFLTATGQNGAAPSRIYGRLDGSIDLRGRGNEADAIIRSLVGNGQIQISDGHFTSFDLMKQVEMVGRLANLPTGGAGTAFRTLKTRLVFEKGTMRTEAVQLTMNDLVATGEGLLRLGDPVSMEYAILARLSPAITRRLLGNRQSPAPAADRSLPGLLGAVVGNFFVEKDSIVIPLKVSGPLSQPTFGLDAGNLRQRARESLIEKFRQGPPENQDQPRDQQQQKPPTPQDAIKGVLDRFIKKKEKP